MAAQKPRPVTSVQATTDEESMAMHSNVQMSMEEAENTKMWARAHSKKAAPRDTIDVGHIELDTLNLQQKSDMLHSVAQAAEKDLYDSAYPQVMKATDEEIK